MILRRFLFSVFLLFGSSTVFASTPALLPAEQCQTLTCVRHHIDIIDANMVMLVGQRLTYVKRAGELKQGKQAVHDAAREQQILMRITQLAKAAGYSPAIAVAIYKTLLLQTNQYERQFAR